MRRADRLLLIVQTLRRSGRPTTARMLAAELEVATRTIYRDIADLQAARVPIEGEAGIGYILRPGYDLPPLMFTPAELDAIVLGAQLVRQRGDTELVAAALDVLAKVAVVVPDSLSDQMERTIFFAPRRDGLNRSEADILPLFRSAIRVREKLAIRYADAQGQPTDRVIWPVAVYFYSHVTLLCAWCELRADFRIFRSDRIQSCTPLTCRFNDHNGALLARFLATRAHEAQE